MVQIIFIVALAGVWLFLAAMAAMHGDLGRAGIYVVAGIVLTGWRIARLRGGSGPPR